MRLSVSGRNKEQTTVLQAFMDIDSVFGWLAGWLVGYLFMEAKFMTILNARFVGGGRSQNKSFIEFRS